jgi:hypothetical protein
MFLWFELANAITMLSPFAAWQRHRKKHKQKRMHKLLGIHIPISMIYHVCCSAPLRICTFVRPHLRVLDLCCIHIYAVVAAHDIKKHLRPDVLCNCNSDTKKWIRVRPSIVKALNVTCIWRIFRGHEDKFTRIVAIYLCTSDGLQQCTRSAKKRVMLLGSLSSWLYTFDTSLYKCGHSLFHLLLGSIHTQLYTLMV